MTESHKSEQLAVQPCTRDITCAYILYRLKTVGKTSFFRYENTIGTLLTATATEAKYLYQYANALADIGEKQHTNADLKIMAEYANHCWGMDKDSAHHFVNSLARDVFFDGLSSWTRMAGILESFHKIVSSTLSNQGNLQCIAHLLDIWISVFESLPLGPDGSLYLDKWLLSKKGWNSVLIECKYYKKLPSPMKGFANDPTDLPNYIPFQYVVSTSLRPRVNPSSESRTLGSEEITFDANVPKATIMTTSDLVCSVCRGNDLTYIDNDKKVGKCACGRWRCLYPGCKSTCQNRTSIPRHQRTEHKAFAGPSDNNPTHCKCGKQKKRDNPIGECECGIYYCAIDNCKQQYVCKADLYRHQYVKHGIAKPRHCSSSHCKCGKQKKREKAISECECGRYYCGIDNCEKEYVTKPDLHKHQRHEHGIPLINDYKYIPTHCQCGNQKKRDKPIGKCECGRYYCGIDNCEKEYVCKPDLYRHQYVKHGIAKPGHCSSSHCKCGKQKKREKAIIECECGRYYCGIDNCEKEYGRMSRLHKHQCQVHSTSRKK